jgi:hypothetical protein
MSVEVPRTNGVRVDPDQILRACALRGWTRWDLGKWAGISPATVSNALRGDAISQHTFGKIARALAQAEPVGAELLPTSEAAAELRLQEERKAAELALQAKYGPRDVED